ncbi:hypothetical protein [Herbiconiux liangxiaofengii]|uniref:hypothetical protein n=1 Tax=Herbiconiux liangxiaofengii TaxID=3342795 RepID=UPI0035B98801
MSRTGGDFSRPRLLEVAPLPVVEFVRDLLSGGSLSERPAADGFTASVASIVSSDDGRDVFVKAGPTADPGGAAVRVGAELAEIVSDLGPALLGWAERDGWYVAVYERLAGAAVEGWRSSDLEGLAALASVMRERFDPSPVLGTEAYADAFSPLLGTWAALADHDGPAEESVAHLRGRVLPYALRVETLAELEADWTTALRGGAALQHGDIRRDNVMREPSGRLRLVDWTHRWTAPSWADWVRLVPDVAADGFDPERVFGGITGADPPQHEVNVMLAGLAGRCWRDGHRDAVPGLPQLRPMQRLQGDLTMRWLAQRGVL